MDNFGNFTRKYIREVTVQDNDGKAVSITLKYTALTPILYMNYFGADMFDDIAKMAVKNADQQELLERAAKDGIDTLSPEEIGKISADEIVVFFDRFAVSLVATAIYPTARDAAFIREYMLPDDFIYDEKYSEIFAAIQELYIPALDDYKKKLLQIRAHVRKT